MRALLLSLTLLATSLVHAASPMSGDEFDAYSSGKTLTFAVNGVIYGAEEYLDNRRVRWSFMDGDCKEGVWYEEAGGICFLYEDRDQPICWTFQRGPNGLIAQVIGDDDPLTLYEVSQSDEPMLCYGPDIGV